METFRILALNPGSTSTKIAIYENEREIFRSELQYENDSGDLHAQYRKRKDDILRVLTQNGQSIDAISAVVGRGGALPPVRAGAYIVNEQMVQRLMEKPIVAHAANFGAAIAYEIAKSIGKTAYIYDSISVNEVLDICKVTGISDLERLVISHPLNMRAAAEKYADEQGKPLEDIRAIVAHLGGGISICAISGGRIVDVVTAGEGPISPNRIGKLSPLLLARYIYSGKHSKEEVMQKIMGRGGLIELLGTDKLPEVEQRAAAGEKEAALVYEAMAYQVSKAICEMAAILCGKVDSVILTGGIAHSKGFTKLIEERVSFLAPVVLYPGENELRSLALGILRVLRGTETAREYSEETACSVSDERKV